MNGEKNDRVVLLASRSRLNEGMTLTTAAPLTGTQYHASLCLKSHVQVFSQNDQGQRHHLVLDFYFS